MQISKLINKGSKKLKSNDILSHQLDSELIISKILNKNREQIIVNSDLEVSKKIIQSFNELIERRMLK